MRRLLVLLGVLIWTGSAHGAASFVVHPDQPLMERFEGFGAQCNGWLYCSPNWGTISTEQNIAQLEKLFIDLAPQQVRIFVEIQPESPQGKDPAVKASVIRTIELAGRAGATVNCTLWHGPYSCIGDSAQAMVDMMVDFIRVHHLTNIKFVTIQNEPNEFGFDMGRLNSLYQEFEPRLRWAGLRDQIKIISGDLVSIKQADWFDDLANNVADVSDGYSVHMYCDYWNRAVFDARIPDLMAVIAKLPPEAKRPLYLNEFGFRGHREDSKEEPGKHANGMIITDTPDYGVLYSCRIIDALNHGFVSMLSWDAFDARYDRTDLMRYAPIGWRDGNWYTRPYYQVFKMFTHTAKVGWQSVKVDGPRDDVFVAAMKSNDGEFTLYAANRSQAEQSIHVAGIVHQQPLHVWTWNSDGKGALAAAAALNVDGDGGTTITLPPMSVMAASTLQPEFK